MASASKYLVKQLDRISPSGETGSARNPGIFWVLHTQIIRNPGNWVHPQNLGYHKLFFIINVENIQPSSHFLAESKY